MITAPDLPTWAAFLVGFLMLSGALTTFLGTIGLLRLKLFYERVHAPTLGTTLGTGFILLASILCFSVLQSRPVVHEILIVIFLTVTAPITFTMLMRAALYRDRSKAEKDLSFELMVKERVIEEAKNRPWKEF